ncbi:MAG: hypothetical protein ACE5H2_06280 [Terriglobia bacterium]
MSRRIYLLVALLCLPLLAPLVATAQQEEPLFTYVSDWNIPRAQWAEFTAYGEENLHPVLERLLADGTIVAWGNFVTEVHLENGRTHGAWWSARSIAGIERVLAELRKLPPIAGVAGAKHYDYLLRSPIHRGRATGRTSGYLWVSAVKVRPGKEREWYELWEKYFKPAHDEWLANGTILMYQVEIEVVHTENPRWRDIVYVFPSAEAIDKVDAAYAAVLQKNPALEVALRKVIVQGTHRDFFARLLSYAHK